MNPEDESGSFRNRFTEGSPLGTWVSIGHPMVVEAAARAGFDFVVIDTEHTDISLETVSSLVRAAGSSPGEPGVIVRPPWNDFVRIKRILDIGVDGLLVPMIDTPEEARDLVKATRYPPEGIRGVASGRASGYGEKYERYVAEEHRSLITIAQIETTDGLEHAGEIASVDGIDALFVGPADLSTSLGMFGQWDSPELGEAMKQVIKAGHNADRPVGTITVDPDDIDRLVELGFDFLAAGKDMTTLIETGRSIRNRFDRTRTDAG